MIFVFDWKNAIAQDRWFDHGSDPKLFAELAVDLFDQAKSKLEEPGPMTLELPKRAFQKDVLGLRFNPDKDPNAYLTYEMNRDELNGTEIGVSLNNGKTFLVKYHFAIALKRK